MRVVPKISFVVGALFYVTAQSLVNEAGPELGNWPGGGHDERVELSNLPGRSLDYGDRPLGAGANLRRSELGTPPSLSKGRLRRRAPGTEASGAGKSPQLARSDSADSSASFKSASSHPSWKEPHGDAVHHEQPGPHAEQLTDRHQGQERWYDPPSTHERPPRSEVDERERQRRSSLLRQQRTEANLRNTRRSRLFQAGVALVPAAINGVQHLLQQRGAGHEAQHVAQQHAAQLGAQRAREWAAGEAGLRHLQAHDPAQAQEVVRHAQALAPHVGVDWRDLLRQLLQQHGGVQVGRPMSEEERREMQETQQYMHHHMKFAEHLQKEKEASKSLNVKAM